MRRTHLGAALAVLLAMGGPAGASDGAPDPEPAGELSIAVLPLENLSGEAAPRSEILGSLRGRLEALRVPLLPAETLERFMRKHRMRYTGGLAREMGRALAEETGAGAVLVTSLDLYQEADPPRMALTARLVSTGDDTRILWMDSADRTGDEAPGLLGLGRIHDPREVLSDVTDRLAGSLSRHLSGAESCGGSEAGRDPGPRRFRPRSFFRIPGAVAAGTGPVRIAVLPFANESTTKYAGDILTLQMVRCLSCAGGVVVIEPGVVREALLRARLIQEDGPSLPQADLLRLLLEADVVLFGEVADYVEPQWGGLEPELVFSARAIDTARRQVIWSSSSRGRGHDRVVFFGLGSVPTAHGLASRMARALAVAVLPSLEGAP